MINKDILEELAIDLRSILKIDEEIILNPSHLKELTQKIERYLENIKIVNSPNLSWLLLENGKTFTIHIYGNDEEKFYCLVTQLIFAIILDKKSLTELKLKRSIYLFPRTLSKEAIYLTLAFMMPKKAFYSLVAKYTKEGKRNINFKEVEEKENRYFYKRGKDLGVW